MPLDPRIEKVRVEYGLEKDDFWELPQKKGTWIAKHAALERAAVKAKIGFDMPMVLEAHGETKCVALCVQGSMDGRAEWSIGEASPANNKNGYPYAMAEKRGKDRVILKLIGLHGLAYSEDEADDFKAPSQPQQEPMPPEQAKKAPPVRYGDEDGQARNWVNRQVQLIKAAQTMPALYEWLEAKCGPAGTISDPNLGSDMDKTKKKSAEMYGEIVTAFQEQLRVINRKAA